MRRNFTEGIVKLNLTWQLRQLSEAVLPWTVTMPGIGNASEQLEHVGMKVLLKSLASYLLGRMDGRVTSVAYRQQRSLRDLETRLVRNVCVSDLV